MAKTLGLGNHAEELKPKGLQLPWGEDCHEFDTEISERVGASIPQAMADYLNDVQRARKRARMKPATVSALIREAVHFAAQYGVLENGTFAQKKDED